MASQSANSGIRYEPDDACPPWVAVGAAFQGIMLVLAPTVVIVAIIAKSAGQPDDVVTWAAFATLLVVAVVVFLQAVKFGRMGGGHMMVCGVTPNYLAISIIAIDAGGPAMLASLLVISGIFYYAVALWLPYLRKVITPLVSGTVLLLIAVSILPFATRLVQDTDEVGPSYSGAVIAAVTAALSVILALRAPGPWRPWALTLAILGGCIVAVPFGLYDPEQILSAPWFGMPSMKLPGLDLTPSISFFALIPLFLIVTLMQSIKTIGDNIAVQHASQRETHASDFRLVQGSVYANGTGILLSGLAGSPPTSTYPALSMALINTSGIAARRVSFIMAAILIALAFLPKVSAALLSLPHAVMGGFLLFAVGLLVIGALQSLVRAGLDMQTGMIAGFAFSLGIAMQHHNIVADFTPEPWATVLGNPITVGAITAIALPMLLNLFSARRRRLETVLDASAIPKVDDFLKSIAENLSWNSASTDRLRSVGEESLQVLSNFDLDATDTNPRRIIISAQPEAENVELEFVTVSAEENVEDRLAYLEDEPEVLDEADISLRLLRHYATSVKHQKYQGVDIVTVQVSGTS